MRLKCEAKQRFKEYNVKNNNLIFHDRFYVLFQQVEQ